jgi:serine/threonine protein kinase
METPGVRLEQINCRQCNTAIDVRDREPFTTVTCSNCHMEAVVPVKLGHFHLLKPLGTGGMGTVYKAHDLALDRTVALKVLRKKYAEDSEFLANFSAEARAAAALNHPNIASVYSVGEENGAHFLIMELLEGGSLDNRIESQKKIPETEALDIGIQVANALKAAYVRNVLHCDIKPANILFSDEGVPKVVDFGLARVLQRFGGGAQKAQTAEIWGTPFYIAPERVLGKQEDYRSDIYSLGATLYHAIAGRPPFDAKTADEVVRLHTEAAAESLKKVAPEVSDETARVIARMLAKNPAERYQTHDELIRDLAEARRIAAIPPEERAKKPAPKRSRKAIVVGSAAIVAIIGIVIGYVVLTRPKEGAPPTAVTPVPPTPPVGPPAWEGDWKTANTRLAMGRAAEAAKLYETAEWAARNSPKDRNWIRFYQAVALILDGKSSAAEPILNELAKRETPVAPPRRADVEKFPATLAQVLTGQLRPEAMVQNIPQLPPWAAASAEFTTGLLQFLQGEFTLAATTLRAYAKVKTNAMPYAYGFQAAAEPLARDAETVAATVARAEQLRAANNLDGALQTLRTARLMFPATQTRIVEAAKPIETQRALIRAAEQRAREEAEAKARAEAEARARQIATEMAQLTALQNDRAVQIAMREYNFAEVASKYRAAAPSFTTDVARQAHAELLQTADWLAQFKNQLSTDIARKPYDKENLLNRRGGRLIGTLARATATELAFKIPHGEVLAKWADLPPDQIVVLAASYLDAFPTDPRDRNAQRHWGLAIFCRTYGLERQAEQYARRAVELQPAYRSDAQKIFGNIFG